MQLGVPEERYDWPEHDSELVGEHGVHEDGRLEQRELENGSRRRNFRVSPNVYRSFSPFELFCHIIHYSLFPSYLSIFMPVLFPL